jgi:site-specific DNA-cytosine methylase
MSSRPKRAAAKNVDYTDKQAGYFKKFFQRESKRKVAVHDSRDDDADSSEIAFESPKKKQKPKKTTKREQKGNSSAGSSGASSSSRGAKQKLSKAGKKGSISNFFSPQTKKTSRHRNTSKGQLKGSKKNVRFSPKKKRKASESEEEDSEEEEEEEEAGFPSRVGDWVRIEYDSDGWYEAQVMNLPGESPSCDCRGCAKNWDGRANIPCGYKVRFRKGGSHEVFPAEDWDQKVKDEEILFKSRKKVLAKRRRVVQRSKLRRRAAQQRSTKESEEESSEQESEEEQSEDESSEQESEEEYVLEENAGDDDDDDDYEEVVEEEEEDDDDDSEYEEEEENRKKKKKKKKAPRNNDRAGADASTSARTVSEETRKYVRKRKDKETSEATKKRNIRMKAREKWIATQRGTTDVAKGKGGKKFFDPCLMEGDINLAPVEVLKKQAVKMLPLIKNALKHGDFPAPLRLQTACSGTDAPAIACQMFSEMYEQLDGFDLNVKHVMSCEIEPFKQAYLARNFEGVKLFADVADLANESREAPTAFGGKAKVPDGDLFVAGTVCKDFSGLRTSNKKDHLENKGKSGETFCAVINFLYQRKPKFAIFENVLGAPWLQMQHYIEGRLPLWGMLLKASAGKKGGTTADDDGDDADDEGDNGIQLKEEIFFKVIDGKWTVDELEIKCKLGVRLGAVVNGYAKGYEEQKRFPLKPRHLRPEGTVVGLTGLADILELNIAEDEITFETPVQYRCRFEKVVTNHYGLPQVRQRKYMFVYKPEEFEEEFAGQDIGELWVELMEILQDPVVYSLTSFLPKSTDARVRRFREVLRGPVGAKTKHAKARANNYALGISKNWNYATQVRSGKGKYGKQKKYMLNADARPWTNWGKDGKMSHIMYNAWPELLDMCEQRKRDMLDIFAGASANLMPPRDALHNGFFWDISQNVHMASLKSATPGIAGCLTPGGWSFLPHLGRTLTGTEKLLFQGIPVDRLQLGQESEVQLSDLAGNAMSLTVVSAAMLATLCVKQFARERKSNPEYNVPEPVEQQFAVRSIADVPVSDENEHSAVNKGKLKIMARNLAKLSNEALHSSILCVCETSGGKSEEAIFWCKDCNLSICRSCCNTQVDLSCHRIEPLEGMHMDPIEFEQKLWSFVEPALMFERSLQESEDESSGKSEKYIFMLKAIERERTRWKCVYVARNADGKPIADLRIFVGALKFGSRECGVKGLIRPFPSNKRGVLDLKWRFTVSSTNGASDIVWERRVESDTEVNIKSVSGERTPSYRVQMGVYKENKNFDQKKPGKDWKLYTEWPNQVDLFKPSRENKGAYTRVSCRGVAAQNILYNSENGNSIYMRPNVDLTGEDDIVLAGSPSYLDTDEVKMVFKGLRWDDVLHPRKQGILLPAQMPTQIVWEKEPGVVFLALSSTIEVVAGKEEDNTELGNDVLVATIKGLSSNQTQYISQPTLEALKRKNRRGRAMNKIPKHLSLRLDRVGQTSAMTEKRFSSLLNPSLLRFGSKQKSNDLFGDSDKNLKNFSAAETWGFDTAQIPPRPRRTWRVHKRAKGKFYYEPIYDTNESNAFEEALGNRPTPWQVQASDSEMKIIAKPSVVAHRATAALLQGRYGEDIVRPGGDFHVQWKLTQPDKSIHNVPSSFVIPTSEEYSEARDPTMWNKNLPLYPRQQRALGRMQEIESEMVRFCEEERREFGLPGVGWRLEAKASLVKTMFGGVLGDVMGGGKTATTIALIAHSRAAAEKRRTLHENKNANKLGTSNYSQASLVLVPDNLIGSWEDEIKKFTGSALKVFKIEDSKSLTKITKKDLCQADIVLCSMEILCKNKAGNVPSYIDNLRRQSGHSALPDKVPMHLGQKATESLVGVWIPGHPAEPYAGTKGNQEKRNISAYFTEHYKAAIESLRRKPIPMSARCIPVEYFEWERVVFDECHEATCPGVGEVGEEDAKVSSHKGPLAAREIMGVASVNLKDRPLLCRKGIWGLTGTPMLSTVERTTELASMCGGSLVCGASKHWRNMERASGRDMFLGDLDSSFFASGAYRLRCFEHAQKFITTAVQRNRTTEYKGTKKDDISFVRMSKRTERTVGEIRKELEADTDLSDNSLSLSLADSKPVIWRKLLRALGTDEDRGTALVQLALRIHAQDKTTKIVVFAPLDCGAFDVAKKSLQQSLNKGINPPGESKLNYDYIDNKKSAEERRAIIRRFSNPDACDSDKRNPRVLLLPFSHAAGHNFQYVSRDAILFAPLWLSSDLVEAIAKEQQAIGRVFRSGQKRKVNIHRFILKPRKGKTETVEKVIYAQNNLAANIEAACST